MSAWINVTPSHNYNNNSNEHRDVENQEETGEQYATRPASSSLARTARRRDGPTHVKCLKRAVDIINNLEASKFPLLLSRITQVMQTAVPNEKAFSSEEEEKLQVSLGLEKSDVKLLLESTTFIIEQAAYYMTKPSVLQRHLSDTLKLNEDKCDAFVNVWVNSAKGIVEHLRKRSLFPAQLEDVRWSLNLQTASGTQIKQVIPKAVFQFGLKTDENICDNVTVGFTHKELYEFYKHLETIQSQLDELH